MQHRQSKRYREMALILDAITAALPSHLKSCEILEFGAGDGFQISFLKKWGHVTALDLSLNPGIKAMDGINAVEGSIADTPFPDDHFDIIFSNHVIEHLEDPEASFLELKRIGRSSCLYAFSVPTHLWLLLTVPMQYWGPLKRSVEACYLRVKNMLGGRAPAQGGLGTVNVSTAGDNSRASLWQRMIPRGHGVEENFQRCYKQFKTSSWKKYFAKQGFTIIAVKPLLLYGPSEFPVIPTIPAAAIGGLASSVLFI